MKHIGSVLGILCMAWVTLANDPYDFRASKAYQNLPESNRSKLEIVHRDFMTLWGALDRYADHHDGELPDNLDVLVPRYLAELPYDPFATEKKATLQGYVPSNNNRGYLYRKGAPGQRAWVLCSVGLPDFPYLAKRNNISLYICKGVWISGVNPLIGHIDE